MPVAMADKGTSRSLNDEAVAEIYRIKKEYPRMNATQIHERPVQESFIPATVSVDSVQRFIRHNDLKQPGIQTSATAKPTKRIHSARSGRQISAICHTSRKTARPDGSTASWSLMTIPVSLSAAGCFTTASHAKSAKIPQSSLTGSATMCRCSSFLQKSMYASCRMTWILHLSSLKGRNSRSARQTATRTATPDVTTQ